MVLSSNAILASANGKFFSPNGDDVSVYAVDGTLATRGGWLVAVPGTLNNLVGLVDIAVATNPLVLTVYKNNVITALTISIGVGATTATDAADQVAVVQGDYISIKQPTNTTTGTVNYSTGLQFVPT